MQQPQSLDQIIAGLNQAYQPQVDILNTERGGLGAKYDSQRTALDAQKVHGFNTINDNANAKGLAFSGIPMNEQANYLSTQYLPGMQKLTTQQNEDDLALQKSLASINSEKVLKATDIRQQQQTAYETYLENERQRAFQAEQTRLERANAAAIAAANRAASATIAAADRAASATPAVSVADLINAWGDKMYASQGDAYRKNYAWENSSIKGQLAAMGVSGEDSYKLRKRYLGY